ncbi:HEPN domain-containing protein [Sphingobacterium multivorum]|uniref:HEPN domain-containing protein n=1 Tax=Sphingobacterium multivorum TaxID=28454 RepID=UPI0028A7A83E|nr:HEPN domain-containing protein [Sphingobacterium multivorum]
MKMTIDHLPENKQEDIRQILEIIKEEANPVKVILFGSHANGNWVEDEYVENGVRFSYISDYDFLVVIKKGEEKEHAIISHIENRSNHVNNVVSPIVHDIDYINEGLRFGQYFFTDIINKGILLFDDGNYIFDEPKILTPIEEKEKAQRYFDIWFPQAQGFLKGVYFYLTDKELRLCAFSLHQAAECLYSAVLLVYTGYKPKTHNLQKLRNYAKHISTDLYQLFLTPAWNEREQQLFDLLKKGYIDARYKLDYMIAEDDLKELISKVKKMQELVNHLCQNKIESF